MTHSWVQFHHGIKDQAESWPMSHTWLSPMALARRAMERVMEVSVRSAMVGRGSWLISLRSISVSCARALAFASASRRSSFCTRIFLALIYITSGPAGPLHPVIESESDTSSGCVTVMASLPSLACLHTVTGCILWTGHVYYRRSAIMCLWAHFAPLLFRQLLALLLPRSQLLCSLRNSSNPLQQGILAPHQLSMHQVNSCLGCT